MSIKKGSHIMIVDHYLDINGLICTVEDVYGDRTGDMIKVRSEKGSVYYLYDDEYEAVHTRDNPSKWAQIKSGIGLGTLLSVCLLFALAMVSFGAKAETTITPFFEAGIYHRDCALSDPLICKNENMGTDTPGTLGAGFEISDCRYFLGADTCSFMWTHYSYADAGEPFNPDRAESQLDAYGFRARWLIDSWSFSF